MIVKSRIQEIRELVLLGFEPDIEEFLMDYNFEYEHLLSYICTEIDTRIFKIEATLGKLSEDDIENVVVSVFYDLMLDYQDSMYHLEEVNIHD